MTAILVIVASLVFVGIEVRQRSVATNSATKGAVSDSLNVVNLAIASSPELVNALAAIAGIYEDAPLEEQLRALAVWRAVFDGWSNVHRQHLNGTIDSALYDALRQEISGYAAKYYGSDAPDAIERRRRQMMWAWESERSNYDRDFQSFVDDFFGVKP
jgi:hypothetical protein